MSCPPKSSRVLSSILICLGVLLLLQSGIGSAEVSIVTCDSLSLANRFFVDWNGRFEIDGTRLNSPDKLPLHATYSNGNKILPVTFSWTRRLYQNGRVQLSSMTIGERKIAFSIDPLTNVLKVDWGSAPQLQVPSAKVQSGGFVLSSISKLRRQKTTHQSVDAKPEGLGEDMLRLEVEQALATLRQHLNFRGFGEDVVLPSLRR